MRKSLWNCAICMATVLLMAGCGNHSGQKTNEEMNTDSVKQASSLVNMQNDSLLATLTLDGTPITWIRDNAKERLM